MTMIRSSLTLGLVAISLSANIHYVQVNFNDLNSGSLVQQGAGMGFAENSSWEGSSLLRLSEGDLQAIPPEGERFVRAQHGEAFHLRTSSNEWQTVQRPLSSDLGGKIWFRYLVDPEAGSAVGLGFDEEHQPFVYTEGMDLVVRSPEDNQTWRVSNAFTANRTALVLGFIQPDEESGQIAVWVDPDVSDRGDPLFEKTDLRFGRTSFASLSLSLRGEKSAMDDVVVSTHPYPDGYFHVAPRLVFTGPIHTPIQVSDEVTQLPPPGYELVWYDEFEGDSVDEDKWYYRTRPKEFSAHLPENVEVRDGHLIIHVRQEEAQGYQYTGGGVRSKDLFVYGYYEARFKVPDAEGWHTSFWTFPVWDIELRGTEIDFAEQDSGDPHYYSFGLIDQRERQWVDQNVGRWVVEDAPNMAREFVVVSAEFTPDYIRFYLNGRLKKEVPSAAFPQGPMNIRLSSIATHKKGDRFQDNARLPSKAKFDYVRLYQHPRYKEAEAAAMKKPTERTIRDLTPPPKLGEGTDTKGILD